MAKIDKQPPPAGEEIHVTDLDALLAQHSGAGFEEVRADDLAVPFFKLLQSGSPEAKPSEADFIEGAREGMWLDTVTRTLYWDFLFVPVKMVSHYIEWKPNRGGYVRNWGTDSTILDRCTYNDEENAHYTPAGNEIVRTAYWFGIISSGRVYDGKPAKDTPDTPMRARAILAFSSTSTRESKKWVGDAQNLRLPNGAPAPLWAMAYNVGAKANKNDAGSWFVPRIERAGWIAKMDKDPLALANEAIAYGQFAASSATALGASAAQRQGQQAIEGPGRTGGPGNVAPPHTDTDEIPF